MSSDSARLQLTMIADPIDPLLLRCLPFSLSALFPRFRSSSAAVSHRPGLSRSIRLGIVVY